MTAPSAPPPKLASPFGPFTQLTGGERVEIAPGPRLVTLHASSATWWDGDSPVSATLPNVPVRGAQWANGALLVGLGSLDLGAKTWTGDMKLARYAQRGPRGEMPVREVAWLADHHAALLIESRDAKGTRTTEVVIVRPDGSERARKVVPQAAYVVASSDRVLVGGGAGLVLDLDAKVVAELATPPRSFGAKESGGNFAIVATDHTVVVVRGSDGSVLGTVGDGCDRCGADRTRGAGDRHREQRQHWLSRRNRYSRGREGVVGRSPAGRRSGRGDRRNVGSGTGRDVHESLQALNARWFPDAR